MFLKFSLKNNVEIVHECNQFSLSVCQTENKNIPNSTYFNLGDGRVVEVVQDDCEVVVMNNDGKQISSYYYEPVCH